MYRLVMATILLMLSPAVARAATQIQDTGYTGISGPLFSGRMIVSAPDMTTPDGRTILRWQREYTITNGVILARARAERHCDAVWDQLLGAVYPQCRRWPGVDRAMDRPHERASLGPQLGVTCSAPTSIGTPYVSARTAGTSFTISITGSVSGNPACFSFFVIN